MTNKNFNFDDIFSNDDNFDCFGNEIIEDSGELTTNGYYNRPDRTPSAFDDGSGGMVVCGNYYPSEEAEALWNDGTEAMEQDALTIDDFDNPLAMGQLLPQLSGDVDFDTIESLSNGDWGALDDIGDIDTYNKANRIMGRLADVGAFGEIASVEEALEESDIIPDSIKSALPYYQMFNTYSEVEAYEQKVISDAKNGVFESDDEDDDWLNEFNNNI